jgi:hypothetical protein
MKTTVSSLVVAGLLLGLPACVVVNNPHPHGPPPAATTATPATATPVATAAPVATVAPTQPVYTETPEPTVAPVESPRNIAEGRPSGFHRGAGEAYWVWHDGAGWHLRTTTQSHLHRFTGRVWGLKGEVSGVHVVRTELNDRFRKSGNSMTFDFHTLGDEDGFDFQIAESNCALFHLYLDGKPVPSRIFLGAQNATPPGATFKACQ